MNVGSAFVAGAAVALDEAVAAAALALEGARLALVTGLDADMLAVRAAHRLARACDGVIDHAQSGLVYPFLSAFRDAGIVMGSPAEIRRRADCLLLVGDGIADAWPGFAGYLLGTAPDLPEGAAPSRRVFWLGPAQAPCALPALVDITFVPCAPDRLTEALGVIRAELGGRRHRNGPLDAQTLSALAAFLRGARFGAIAWAACATDAIGTEMVAGLVDDLNDGRRFTGLPLLPADSAYGAALVSTAMTGFPLRVAFVNGIPRYDPVAFDGAWMRAQGACDIVLSISDTPQAAVAGADIAIGPDLAADAGHIVLRTGMAVDGIYFQRELASFGRSAKRAPGEGPPTHQVIDRLARAVRQGPVTEDRPWPSR